MSRSTASKATPVAERAVRTVRIFLVDDHAMVREGLRSLFDSHPDLQVAGEAGSVREAEARIPTAHADVALVDLQLPDGSGAEVCQFVSDHHPEVRCLVLTSFANDEAVFQAVRAGAAGYVLKQIHSDDLIRCVRRVAAGETLLDARSRARVRNWVAEGESDRMLATLTDQQRVLLSLIAEGLTNREIADRMMLSDKTVKNYVSSLLMKLGVSRRAGAAAYHVRAEERKDLSMHDPDAHAGPIRY